MTAGAWRALRTLVAGRNTFTAVASVAQANSTSTFVTVTTKCKVPTVKRMTVAKAKAALKAHWCGFRKTVMLLYLSSGQYSVDVAGDVAFEAAHDF